MQRQFTLASHEYSGDCSKEVSIQEHFYSISVLSQAAISIWHVLHPTIRWHLHKHEQGWMLGENHGRFVCRGDSSWPTEMTFVCANTRKEKDTPDTQTNHRSNMQRCPVSLGTSQTACPSGEHDDFASDHSLVIQTHIRRGMSYFRHAYFRRDFQLQASLWGSFDFDLGKLHCWGLHPLGFVVTVSECLASLQSLQIMLWLGFTAQPNSVKMTTTQYGLH